jgi:hypothetical protein
MVWNGDPKLAGANVTRITEVDLEIARLLLEAFLPPCDQTEGTVPRPHASCVAEDEGNTVANSA